MFFRSEKSSLVEKMMTLRPSFEREDLRGGCLGEAYGLYKTYGGGEIYWVGKLTKINLEFGVYHAYFIPPHAQDDSFALNQADNGFGEYPPLTVKELRTIGELQNIDIVRQLLKIDHE